MKKAQVLSVIALAFALGVVAPITLTQSTNAWSVDANDITKGVAGNEDVTAAVAFVNHDDRYINVKNFNEAIDKITNNKADIKDGKYYDLSDTSAVNKINDLKAKVATIEAAVVTPTSGLTRVVFTATPAANKVVANDLQTAINLAKTVSGADRYNAYAALYAAITDDTHAGLKAAIEEYNAALHPTPVLGTSDINMEYWKTTAGIAALKATVADYNIYTALVAVVNEYQEELDSYNAGVTAIFGAVNALARNNQLTEDGSDGFAYTMAASLPRISNAKMLRDGGTLAGITVAGPMIEKYYEWTAVANKMEDMKGLETYNATVRFDRIRTLATNYKVASYPVYSTKTINEVAEMMVKYTAGSENTDPADKNEDLEAPNTGILSTAEGSAATISIVAGLTTALTALGAGVVAYRNARRSE